MNVEEPVATSLEERAATVTPPRPDVTALSRRGNSRSWIRRAVSVGGAAVLVAVVSLSARTLMPASDVDGHATATTALRPEPGEPVWLMDGMLHVGSEAVPWQGGVELVAGGIVSGTGDGTRDEAGAVWFIPWGEERVKIGTNLSGGARGNPTGANAAWIESTADGDHLVVFDTAAGTELGRVDLPKRNDLGDPIVSVEDDVVYVQAPHAVVWSYRWSTDTEVQPTGTHLLNGSDGEYRLDTRNGVWAAHSDSPDSGPWKDSTVTFRDDAGKVLSIWRVPEDAAEAVANVGVTALSPDGRYFVAGHLIVDTRTAETTALPAGAPARTTMYSGWVGDHTTIVLTGPPAMPADGLLNGIVSTCEVPSGQRTPAPGGGDIDRWTVLFPNF